MISFFIESFLENINIILSWEGWTALSAIVLAVTVIYIQRQASATREMAEFQGVPKIAVGMISTAPADVEYNQQTEGLLGTRFELYNYSEAVVWIWKKIEIKVDGETIKELKIKAKDVISSKPVNELLEEDLTGENPLWVLPAGNNHSGFFPTAPYNFFLEIMRNQEINNFKDKKITVELRYWAAYNGRKQKNPKVFGPIPYYFNSYGGWTIGGGVGLPFDRMP